MPLFDSPALTLRRIRLGEADKLITFFTRRYGKIKAVAKGALRPKSRMGGRIEPLIHSNIIFFGKEKTELYSLNSADIQEPFFGLRDDFGKLTRALAASELVDNLQRDKDVNAEGFDMLLAFWRALAIESQTGKQDLLLKLFNLKYLSLAGYQPQLERCVGCASPIEREAAFSPRRGGALCHRCLPDDPSAKRISIGALKMMARGLNQPIERLSRLSAPPALLAEIDESVIGLRENSLRRSMRTERFLKL